MYSIAIEYFLNRNSHIVNRLEMPACGIKVILPILTKIGCHGNALLGKEKWLLLKYNHLLIILVPKAPLLSSCS